MAWYISSRTSWGSTHLWKRNFLGEMPESLDEEEANEVRAMTHWLLKPCIKFLREECAEVSPTQDQNLVQSFMNILMSHLKDFLALDVYKKEEGSEATGKKNIINMIDAVVVLSIIWSIGCVLQTTLGQSLGPSSVVYFRVRSRASRSTRS